MDSTLVSLRSRFTFFVADVLADPQGHLSLSSPQYPATDLEHGKGSDTPLEPRALVTDSITEVNGPTIIDPLETLESSLIRGNIINSPKTLQSIPLWLHRRPEYPTSCGSRHLDRGRDDSDPGITSTGGDIRGLSCNRQADRPTVLFQSTDTGPGT